MTRNPKRAGLFDSGIKLVDTVGQVKDWPAPILQLRRRRVSRKIWDELGKQREEHMSLTRRVGSLKKRVVVLESALREQGCPEWGEQDDGVMGPCGRCAWCRAFLDD